jgi:hypothetical protein
MVDVANWEIVNVAMNLAASHRRNVEDAVGKFGYDVIAPPDDLLKE